MSEASVLTAKSELPTTTNQAVTGASAPALETPMSIGDKAIVIFFAIVAPLFLLISVADLLTSIWR